SPLLSFQPAWQVHTQPLVTQALVAFALLAQATPPSHVVVGPEVQPPQCVMLFVVLISQPLENVPSQSARPAWQVVTAQFPEEQVTAVMLLLPTELEQLAPPSHVVVGPDWQPPQ